MDKRFMIYEGFSQEAMEIFKKLANEFSLSYRGITDGGINLENNKIIIKIFYETGIQVWLFDKSLNEDKMFAKLVRERNEDLYREYRSIRQLFRGAPQNGLKLLSDFMIENFKVELAPSCRT